MMRRRVDFPHPEAPRIKKKSPDSIVSEMSPKTWLRPKLLEIEVMWSAVMNEVYRLIGSVNKPLNGGETIIELPR